MRTKKQIQPAEKVPLKLTATERKLVLEEVMSIDEDYEQILRNTPTGKPLMMTLDDLDGMAGYIAAEFNHCENKAKQRKLDAIFERIQSVQNRYTDEGPPQTLKIEDAHKDKLLSDQAVKIAEFAAQALIAAEQLCIKSKPLANFWLARGHRDALLLIPGLSKTIKNKLTKDKPLSVAEVASVTMAVAVALPGGEPQSQVGLLLVSRHLMERLQEGILAKAEPPPKKKRRTTKKNTGVLYQFKITLLGSDPPIWRRIQVLDCTLDNLHEHIQTAMGWTNSHLHQFKIKDERYGDPDLLDAGFDDFECEDSTTTMLSEILSKTNKRFAFNYEYDFGDGWQHEVLYEGSPPLEKSKKHPLCLEGERACPPEDVGGVWGYGDFLEAIADPKHEQHDDFVEWAGEFDPEDFDPRRATKEMKKGLPDWRSM